MMSESTKLTRFLDIGKTTEGELLLDKYKDKILIYLAEVGISYPTELSRQFNISVEGINQILAYWKKENAVVKYMPHPEDLGLLAGRVHEFNSMGITGYGSFKNFSWWTITEEAIKFLKLKYKEKDLRIKGSLIKHYNLSQEDLNGGGGSS